MKHTLLYFTLLMLFCMCGNKEQDAQIDRFALVNRHNVILTKADTLGSLSVGNGEFAFTVDASGLQTFPDEYANGIPPGTQSQWGWHSFQGENHSLQEVMREYQSCDSTQAPYAIQHREGEAGDATQWLRINPHRVQLGLTSLLLTTKDGTRATLSDLRNIRQVLDLWTGKIETSYLVGDDTVRVEVYAHQEQDAVSATVKSSLIRKGQLKVGFRFPYGHECHTCAGYDWNSPQKHSTKILSSSDSSVILERQLDTTSYYVTIAWSTTAGFDASAKQHEFELSPSPGDQTLSFTIRYSKDHSDVPVPSFIETKNNSITVWKNFWTEGGAVDFSECTDERAHELERRVVLSQYLTRIQCSGSLPPQETGLTMNSWHGKFHLEMHWWHGVHFALWGRPQLLENSMLYYNTVMDKAQATSRLQGYKGARWQKMTDPFGNESPSGIGVFLVWQQPHPIYYAELFYRANPTAETLNRYKDIVFQTADFMASFARLRQEDGKYHLCRPLIPSQEIFKATETDDPAFELSYWYFGLRTAQEWRKRLGLTPDEHWQKVLENLAPLPTNNGLYLPVATVPHAYTDDKYRHDHPSVTGAFGILPQSQKIDTAVMANTFDEIMNRWDWESTWGWDYPMLAMTAARIGKPEKAIDALMLDVQKNTYLINGHNYQDKRLRLYLPGNGGLLTAIAMMAVGWDGNSDPTPGFPKNGKWKVRWEGLKPMP